MIAVGVESNLGIGIVTINSCITVRTLSFEVNIATIAHDGYVCIRITLRMV